MQDTSSIKPVVIKNMQSVQNKTNPDNVISSAISNELVDIVLALEMRHLRLSYL